MSQLWHCTLRMSHPIPRHWYENDEFDVNTKVLSLTGAIFVLLQTGLAPTRNLDSSRKICTIVHCVLRSFSGEKRHNSVFTLWRLRGDLLLMGSSCFGRNASCPLSPLRGCGVVWPCWAGALASGGPRGHCRPTGILNTRLLWLVDQVLLLGHCRFWKRNNV